MPLCHAVSSQNALESHGSQHNACYCGPPTGPHSSTPPASAARVACVHRHRTPLGSFGHERRHTEPERTCRDLGLKKARHTASKELSRFHGVCTWLHHGRWLCLRCDASGATHGRPVATRAPRCSVACFWLAFELAIYMSRSECV